MLSAGCAADKIRHGGWQAKADQEEAMVTCGLLVEAAAAAVYGGLICYKNKLHIANRIINYFLFKLDFKLLHKLLSECFFCSMTDFSVLPWKSLHSVFE